MFISKNGKKSINIPNLAISDLYKENMQKVYKNLWLRSSFLFAIVILIILSGLTYFNYKQISKNAEFYTNLAQIMVKIDESLLLLNEVKNAHAKLSDMFDSEALKLVQYSYDSVAGKSNFLANHPEIRPHQHLSQKLLDLTLLQKEQQEFIDKIKEFSESQKEDIQTSTSKMIQNRPILMQSNAKMLDINQKMQTIYIQLATQIRLLLQQNQTKNTQDIEEYILISSSAFGCAIILFSIGYFVIRRQIDKSYEMASDLIQFREEQLLLLNTMPMGLFRCKMIDERFRPSWASDQVQKITGFSPEAFVEDPYLWETRIHPQDKERVISDYRNIFKTHKVEHEYRWLTAQGEYRWFLEHMILLNQHGELYLIGLWLDINHRKDFEEQIREKTTVMENAVEGIAKVDLEGDYIQINPSYAILLGYHVNDLINTNWTKLIHQDDQKELINGYKSMIQTGKAETEVRSICIDGKEIYTQIVMIKALDADSKMNGHYCFMRDISQRKHTELELKRANEQLMNNVYQLEQRNQEVMILSEMGELLQTCQTSEEAYPIIKHIVKKLFSNSFGSLYILTESKNLFESVISWGENLKSESVFQPEDCWSLRRSHLHQVIDVSNDLLCKHVDAEIQDHYICVPLTSHGEIMGILHIEFSNQHQYLFKLSGQSYDEQSALHHNPNEHNLQRLVMTIAEQVSLALSNLKLRETLQNQSIRDPLTGLFNRRYMEESLEREVSRCRRKKSQLGIMMLDVDYFKRLNDTYGHDAGDVILKGLGIYLKQAIRKEDIACRYGGEEFLLILPDISLEQLSEKALQLNQQINTLSQITNRNDLPQITISVGIALYPLHAQDIRLLINLADMALYRAKQNGRNRVELAQQNCELNAESN